MDDLLTRCLELPGSEQSQPFGEDSVVVKVGGKIFAILDVSGQRGISLKAEPTRAAHLVAQHDAITPGYHLNKRHWITVSLTESLPEGLVDDLVEESYELVVEGLPKRLRPVPPAPL